ncbi:MAG: DUF255 domain-containing protein [Bacteroidia bacterium]|nr:DUF255 domain-containing protein [Bacteroidia bacterium]
MMRKFSVLIGMVLFSTFSMAQNKTENKETENLGLVKWMTIQEAEKLCVDKPRPIMIDFYTDWCGWCKVMMKNTFSHPVIADYINTYFYPVRFNAETKDTVIYRGKTYTNKGTGVRAAHSFAIELLKGQLSYPTIGYIDEAGNISPVPGYMAPNDIEPVLVFFGEKINKYAPFEDFKNNFKLTFAKDSIAKDELVKWYSFPEAVELSKKTPKKILLFLNSKWNNSSKVMMKTTFNKTEIANFLNEHYYPVNLVAESTDTIRVFDQVFINEKLAPNYPHQIIITLLNKQLFYPTLMIMSEQFQMIDKIQGYLTPKSLEPVLSFLSEDKYKTTKYEDFLKTFQWTVK